MTDLSLLQDFVNETVEHLEEMEGNLLQLEDHPGDRGLLNDIFRSVHTIKGAAEYLGMGRIAELSHKLENLLDMLRHDACTANREVIDLLMAARDRIGILTADLHEGQTEQADIEDLLIRIQAVRPESVDATLVNSAANDVDSTSDSTPKPLDSPVSEPYEEEHDEELFGIFLEQLQEGLESLQAWTNALPGADRSDRIEILGRCREQLDPLRSSANYMGYGKLTALYDAWHAAIQSARECLVNDDDTGFTTFLADHMQTNIDVIGDAFPQLKPPESGPGIPPDTVEEDTFSFFECGDEDLSGGPEAALNPDEFLQGMEVDAGALHDPGLPDELRLFPAEGLEPEDPGTGEAKTEALDLGLLQEFVAETVDHLAVMESSLLQLEVDPGDKETLNDLFRSLHTIKGAAEYMGLGRIAELSHKLENLLELLRQGGRTPNRETIDLLMASRDRIGILAADLHQTQTEQADIEDLLGRLQALEDAGQDQAKRTSGGADSDVTASSSPLETEAASENESYEEEHDEELFGIFLEQLEEGLEVLQGWTNALPGADCADRLEILGSCLEQLDRLRSSANYMGYRQLTERYDRWQEMIRTALERLEGEDDGFMPAFIADGMQAGVHDIRRCFPRLDSTGAAAASATSGDATLEGTSTASQAISPIADDLLDAYVQTPDKGTSIPDEGIPAASPIQEDNLYDRLSRSFDHRLAENQSHGADGDASGMEQELFSASPPAGSDRPTPPGQPNPAVMDEAPSGQSTDTSKPPASNDTSLQILPNEQPDYKPENPLPDADRSNQTRPPEASCAALVGEDPGKDPGASRVVVGAPGAPQDLTAEPTEDPPVASAPGKDPEKSPLGDRPRSTGKAQASGSDGEGLRPPSGQTAANDGEQPSGDRRDSLRQGRRQSDRIGDQLLRQSIRVDAGKIDALMNQVGELVVSRAWFSQLFHEMRDLQQNLQHNAGLDPREMKQVKGLTFRLSEATVALGRVANELQEGVMKVRMLPIAQLFNRYPRLVFDLVRDGDKKVSLDIRGEETELDKMVIEAVSDPLIHILRNAVDHGIESVAERKRLGKPESGTIHLEAYHEGNHVVIEIADDGRGLDPERIKSQAIAGRFASPEEVARMPQKELTSLIMLPGFSTALEVTHTSGRGVGMDVVKQNIEKLNGTIEIDTTPGMGTQFRIKIPLTLAIIPALLVQVCGDLFTIPLSTVEETIRIAPQDLSTIEGVEVMELRDSTLPLVRLAELFKMSAGASGDGRAFVVVVSTGMKRVGLVVDALLGQEEVVIKPLEDYLQEKSGFSGATILGDGRISLILDIYELVNLSMDRQARRNRVAGTA